MEVKQLHEDMLKNWTEYKAVHERLEAEIKKLGDGTTETKTHLDKIDAAISAADKTRMDAVAAYEKRLADIETWKNRPDFRGQDATPQASAESKAFWKWGRQGVLTPEEARSLYVFGPGEVKALSVSDQTQAGYLAPTEYVRELIKGVTDFSPIRAIARRRTGSAKAIELPKRTGLLTALVTAELATRTESTGQGYGLETLPAHEYYALQDVSNALLEDSAFDLEAELRGDFSEAFGVAEGQDFVSGTGAGEPEGFTVNAATVAAATTSVTNAVLSADDLITILYALKEAYARNATFVMRRATVADVRKLKGSDLNYLWQPGLAGGAPSTILDRPYVEAPDMTANADGALAVVAVGDFRAGYTIYDRLEVAFVRDPLTQAGTGKMRFHARRRVGGQVVLAEAIKLLNIQ